jgi:hypothetical protein
MGKLALAIILAAALISGAIIFSQHYRPDLSSQSRYAIAPAGQEGIWRVDQITGEIVLCGISAAGAGCGRMPPKAFDVKSAPLGEQKLPSQPTP